MATAILIQLEEYLHTTYHPDCEWVDGELKERAVGEGSHAFIQTFFIKYFAVREAQWGVRVTQELRTQVARSNYRVPDVVVLSASAPFEEIVRTPPLLCIEVLSPDDRMADMQDKIDEYLAMGVRAVWVVNPKRKRAFNADGAGLIAVEELTVPDTPIQIPVADIFAGLDALKAASL